MALRIKDNVDLKELEKFGFKYKNEYDDFYELDLKDNRTYIIVDTKDREIGICTSLYGDLPAQYINNIDIIYDLMKAGLIEKVEDK